MAVSGKYNRADLFFDEWNEGELNEEIPAGYPSIDYPSFYVL
jgi:hypothetical protein